MFVAVVMPRKSQKKPGTLSLEKVCRRRSELVELLEAAAIATKTCNNLGQTISILVAAQAK